MELVHHLAGASGGYLYGRQCRPNGPPDYTARVIPHCHGLAIPLEYSRIAWQRWPDRRPEEMRTATATAPDINHQRGRPTGSDSSGRTFCAGATALKRDV